MRRKGKLAVVSLMVCTFTFSLCSAADKSNEPNAADLVRAVRQSEMWMYHVETLYFQAKGKWTTTPKAITERRIEIKDEFGVNDPNEKQFPGLRKTSEDILEYVVDGKRVRYLTDDPGYWRQLKIWDGNELRIHEKYYNHPQNCYILHNTIPERMFHELFASNYGWPRSQAHSFWWNPQDVTKSSDFYGRPEEFKLIDKQIYRDIPCYVLEYNVPDHVSKDLKFRWFVGQSDHLLYGLQTRRGNQLRVEHWTLDYNEVEPGGWFPMKTGWSLYDTDKAGLWYLQSTKNNEVVDFQLNKSLSDDLFRLIIEPGVEIQDHRSGELRRYKKWPSLLGKELPSLKKFDLPEFFSLIDVPVLLCFVDFEQRPSRNCIMQLANQAEQLKEKGVTIISVQSSKVDKNSLNEWVKKNNIPFPVGMIQGDEEKTRFNWGVKSLPWLILTDRQHNVTAEGFGINELCDKI